MNNTLIQWNCRGLKPNYNEILLLLSKYSPAIFCLQETFLKATDTNISFKQYSLFNYIQNNTERASGGSSILVHSRIPHSKVDLNTPLQAVAVQVTLHKVVTVCSIYLTPNVKVEQSDLENLIKQLPEPFISPLPFEERWGL